MLWNDTEYCGWGRAVRAEGALARPERAANLTSLVKKTPGPAMGMFRSYGDVALNDGGPGIVMTRLDRFLDFDPESGMLEAEAGVTIGEILRVFAPRGWIPGVIPGTGFATLGGCVANDVHGKNHHCDGSFAQTVESLVLIGPDGRSRRVSAKREATLFRATLGGMGLTGVIASARIRMQRISGQAMEVRERRMSALEDFLDALDTSESRFTVGWIDATARAAELGRGIFEEGAVSQRVQKAPRAARAKSVPFDAPGFLLSAPVVRAFNALYYRRVPEAGRTRTRSFSGFFHPLDSVLHWNRLYGRRGFHQFQCVLPLDGAEDVLRRMLEQISESRLASPLAVLKKMGPGRGGPMSFPMEGFTLAVDFPARKPAVGLIKRLEDMTLHAGGRIYLAKDALASAASIERMYPDLAAFRTVIREADPDGVFETDMARRLNLRVAP
ncbi:MAG: FAD-binding protein [Paracoccaceae bacterium]